MPERQQSQHVQRADSGSSPNSEARVAAPMADLPSDMEHEEIAVASPRSKVAVVENRRQPQKSTQKRRRTDSPDAVPKPRKRKRGSDEARAPRGRPREPSQLKPEAKVKSKPTVINGADSDAPAPSKRRRLSEEYAQQIASQLTVGEDAGAPAQSDEVQDAAPEARSTGRKKEKRKQGTAPADTSNVSTVEEPAPRDAEERQSQDLASVEQGQEEVLQDAGPSKVPEQRKTVHSDGRRISAIGRPGPPRRKKQRVSQGGKAPDPEVQAKPNNTDEELDAKRRERRADAMRSSPKRRHIAEALATYLLNLPENASKLSSRELVLSLLEPKTSMADLVEELHGLGLRFEPSLLIVEIQRLLDEWTAITTANRGANAEAQAPQRIPTPPESPTVRSYGVDATDQVIDWLNSQELPVADPNRPTPRARQAGSDDEQDDSSEYLPEREPTVPFSPDARKQPKTARELNIDRSRKVDLPAPVEDGPRSGPFTEAEKAAADAVFEYVCQTYDVEASQLKANIIDWANVGEFKVEVLDVLPNRTKAAVRKFCHRRYTADDTGPWTVEQDEKLRRAYASHPNQWNSIADLVDRSGQSCRDRWRDHVQYGDKQVTGPWSRDEEDRLVGAVKKCVETIRKDALKQRDMALAEDRERMEGMIDWGTVSKAMDGQRSRRRCREKWQNLKRRNPDVDAGRQADLSATAPKPAAFDGQTKKQKAVESKFKQFQYGDFYDVLVEIHTAIDDHSKVFGEESTLWSIIATKNKGSRFSGALRRRAYYAALENYVNGKKVGRATTVAAKAKAMVLSMDKWAETHGRDVFVKGYDPIADKEKKDAEKEDAAMRKAARQSAGGAADGQRASRRKSGAKAKKSEEYVGDDSSDDEAEQAPVDAGGVLPDIDMDGSDGEAEVPVAQLQKTRGSARRMVDALEKGVVSPSNSMWDKTPSKPYLSRRKFLERCKAADEV